MADKNRPLHILKYLWDHTDEEHPAIITDNRRRARTDLRIVSAG